jgi:hypothetical protein
MIPTLREYFSDQTIASSFAEQKETMNALSIKSRHGLRESFALAKACVVR